MTHPRVVASPVNCEALAARKHPWIAEHRLVMSYELGRELRADEVVHHIDGNKLNNIPRNLVTVNRAEHQREHISVVRELRALRRENAELRAALKRMEKNGSR